MGVKIIVKNGEYYNKKNEYLKCLDCEIRCNTASITWKDFKQKVAFEIDEEVDPKKLLYVENRGYNYDGFVLPWNVQYALKQMIDKGLIKHEQEQ